MDETDQVFASVAERQAGYAPTIACLYTGAAPPSSCAPMLRSPEPAVGQVLDSAFADHLAAALAVNAAVHDGAVMLGRECVTSLYLVCGWSYRLFPACTAVNQEPNRGSAFNSCQAMSAVPGVDRVYLVAHGSVYRFENGSVEQL